MAILEKEVLIGLNPQLTKHLTTKGYTIPKTKNKYGIESVKKGTEIIIKVEDLTDSSMTTLTKICDFCGKKVKTSYHHILRGRKSWDDGKDRCKKCSDKHKIEKLNNKKIKKNCIDNTNKEFAKLLWKKEDSLIYTIQSNKKIDFKCPDCGTKVENKRIQDVYKYGLSCPNCSDGYSYPEKFMFNLLKQLNIKFETQKSFDWIDSKRYDFYLNNLNCIIETHGLQHYEGEFLIGLEQQKSNDKYKKQMAINNAIKTYIELDSRRSTLEFMKKSILNNSDLNKLLDIEKVDFIKCHEFAINSLVKIVSEMYKKGNNIKIIAEELSIDRHTVSRYLKISNEVGWTNYEKHSGKFKQVIQLSLDNIFINEFKSLADAERKTGSKNLSSACNGRYKTSGGYKWMYKEDYEKQLKC